MHLTFKTSNFFLKSETILALENTISADGYACFRTCVIAFVPWLVSTNWRLINVAFSSRENSVARTSLLYFSVEINPFLHKYPHHSFCLFLITKSIGYSPLFPHSHVYNKKDQRNAHFPERHISLKISFSKSFVNITKFPLNPKYE